MPIQTIKENLEESPVLFLTLKIIDSLPVFINKAYFEIILNCLRWYRQNNKFKIYAYTILINHIHLVLEFNDFVRGEQIVGDFKRYTTKLIVVKLREDGHYDLLDELHRAGFMDSKKSIKIWRDNNWPMAIMSDKFFNQKVDYVDYNATHHGIVQDIEDYLYTSFHNHYCKHQVLLEIDEVIY